MAVQRKFYDEAEASLRKGDAVSAIKKFEHGFSEEGDARCLRRLGKLCEDGAPGTDPVNAVTWYEKGAEAGDRECALRAGILYAEGRHTGCDYDKAFGETEENKARPEKFMRYKPFKEAVEKEIGKE